MDPTTIDWELAGKIILGILALIFGTSWVIKKRNHKIGNINGNNNTVNNGDQNNNGK
ncbi:hypothetical protein [Acinetobacter baylyi]|uniref:hypothetical protein n=1 Tax=Acinetobacter baylyi TaxID=202950 RepID=UPI0031DD4510